MAEKSFQSSMQRKDSQKMKTENDKSALTIEMMEDDERRGGCLLTVALLDVLGPPHHGVGLPVPDAGDGLLGRLLRPGQLVVGAVVGDGVPQLPPLVRPRHVHAHHLGRPFHTTLPL